MTATPLRPGPELSATMVFLQFTSTLPAVDSRMTVWLLCILALMAGARVCLLPICCCAMGPWGAKCRKHVNGWNCSTFACLSSDD